MGLNVLNITLSDLLADKDLRCDCKFFSFWSKSKWNFLDKPLSKDKSISLKEVLLPSYSNFQFDEDTEYKGIPTGKEYLDEHGFIISYQNITKEEKPDRLKYAANKSHILISSLRGAKSPALNFDYDISNYVFSNGFYIFKVQEGWNIRFILHLLRNNWLKTAIDNNIYRGIGISAYKENDLLKIRLPLISIDIQNECAKQIAPIEQSIFELKSKIKSDSAIINDVFSLRFILDLCKFEELKQIHIINNPFAIFANNQDVRFSFKFHNKAGEYVMSVLKAQTSKRIKDYIAEDITLGKGISPSDYYENGEQYYISMADIKNWRFETEEAKKVLQSYFNANPNKRIAINDIIMARSGEGTIGKVALIDNEEIEGVYADFTMRIRLKNYNPLFAYYYFRSDFFQHLIYTHKKGLGNNTNIFPSQIQEFPIPELTLKQQENIVSEIKASVDEQREIEKQIKEKQQEISKIIEVVIKQSQ